ncbi:MAG: hypothetical protein ACJ8M4_01800 [Chthoniobacterales bacterium]
MALPKDKAWFAAKRYGYGWGLPKRWQGWLVLAIYLFLLLFGGLQFAGERSIRFLVYAGILTILLIAICAWKGEAPRWRWGRADDDI